MLLYFCLVQQGSPTLSTGLWPVRNHIAGGERRAGPSVKKVGDHCSTEPFNLMEITVPCV